MCAVCGGAAEKVQRIGTDSTAASACVSVSACVRACVFRRASSVPVLCGRQMKNAIKEVRA